MWIQPKIHQIYHQNFKVYLCLLCRKLQRFLISSTSPSRQFLACLQTDRLLCITAYLVWAKAVSRREIQLQNCSVILCCAAFPLVSSTMICSRQPFATSSQFLYQETGENNRPERLSKSKNHIAVMPPFAHIVPIYVIIIIIIIFIQLHRLCSLRL